MWDGDAPMGYREFWQKWGNILCFVWVKVPYQIIKERIYYVFGKTYFADLPPGKLEQITLYVIAQISMGRMGHVQYHQNANYQKQKLRQLHSPIKLQPTKCIFSRRNLCRKRISRYSANHFWTGFELMY